MTIFANWFKNVALVTCLSRPVVHSCHFSTSLVEINALLPFSLSHSNINTSPSCHVPSLLYLPGPVNPTPPSPPQKKTKNLCSFKAESGLRCSYQARETRAPTPRGTAVILTQVRKHTPKSRSFCFSCFTTFFLKTATWRNMIVPGCSGLSPAWQTTRA